MCTDGISKRTLVRKTKFLHVLVRDWNILFSFCPEMHSFSAGNTSFSPHIMEFSSLWYLISKYDRAKRRSSVKVLLLIMCPILAEKLVWRRLSREKEHPLSLLHLEVVPGRGWLLLAIYVNWFALAWGSHFIADRSKAEKADVKGLVRWLFHFSLDWYTYVPKFVLQSFRHTSCLLLQNYFLQKSFTFKMLENPSQSSGSQTSK